MSNSKKVFSIQASPLRSWDDLGARPAQYGGQQGWRFRVWAPRAAQVCVMGEFNGWDRTSLPMVPSDGGIWEGFVPDAKPFDAYKYVIRTADGRVLDKSDPFAFHAETRPKNASKCFDLSGYGWGDRGWMDWRGSRPVAETPLNIYELHPDSWRRKEGGEPLSYPELADRLIPYVKGMGFTHVQLLPVTEHPLDASLGYQSTGLFAPTSRFGTPHDFMYLVDCLHRAGIGVFLELPLTFVPEDDFALCGFDGLPLYESADVRAQDGCPLFDLNRPEVRGFLTACALFWAEVYHADGLRIHLPPTDDGAFRQELYRTLAAEQPDVTVIAEPEDDGLPAPRLVWQRGGVGRLLQHLRLDPYFRAFSREELLFSPPDGSGAVPLLPISHDDVTPSAGSLPEHMYGTEAERFSALRALYVYLLARPGKSLTMMGCEFGQQEPWRFDRPLDWRLTDRNRAMQTFVREANALYLRTPALWQRDAFPDGFLPVRSDAADGTAAFLRFDRRGRGLLAVFNFSPAPRAHWRIGVPRSGRYTELFSTDPPRSGGESRRALSADSEPVPRDGQAQSLLLELPPLSAVLLTCPPARPSQK